MKVAKEGVPLFSGILKTCLFEKGEFFSLRQAEFAKSKGEVSMDEFAAIFPVESETVTKLMEAAQILGKDTIDKEVLLNFFGGDLHMRHVEEDFFGLPENLKNLLLAFHAVVAVKLEKKGESWTGIYKNGDVEFRFEGIESIDILDPAATDPDKKVLIHFGSIFGFIRTGSEEDKILLGAQAKSERFMETCRKNKSLDCEKLLRALQLQKTKRR